MGFKQLQDTILYGPDQEKVRTGVSIPEKEKTSSNMSTTALWTCVHARWYRSGLVMWQIELQR